MGRNKKNLLRNFHQAKWDEQIIFQMHTPGERGIFVPQVESSVKSQISDGLSILPKVLRRHKPPSLPEISQFRVLRHFLHLSEPDSLNLQMEKCGILETMRFVIECLRNGFLRLQ